MFYKCSPVDDYSVALFFFCNYLSINKFNLSITFFSHAHTADAAQCTSATYAGSYSSEKCRTGCGELSQGLYKLPSALLHPSGR